MIGPGSDKNVFEYSEEVFMQYFRLSDIVYLFPFSELHCCSKVDYLYCLAIFFGQNNVFRLTNIQQMKPKIF